jgi:fatty-acyl-CoA synthase
VTHPDGVRRTARPGPGRDRLRWEDISTVEVEQAVISHPAVLETAVVGVPDARWGERSKALIVLELGETAREQDIVVHVRRGIAGFKAPRDVSFVASLPKTSTGKVQKFELREKEWAGHASRIRGDPGRPDFVPTGLTGR